MNVVKCAASRLWGALTAAEKAVLAMLAVFSGKFLFSALARRVEALRAIDALGSGRSPVDVWLLLLCLTAWLGMYCLYRRAIRALPIRLRRFDWLLLAAVCLANLLFYYGRVAGRSTIYYWDYATYYQLQVRLESNFADGVFVGVGSTIYKTWFNDYAPLVISLLTEPLFMFTDRTANTYAMLSGMFLPWPVYLSALVLLARLRELLRLRYARLFTALGLAATALFPLLHAALYRGMPDMLGVAWALMLLALLAGYDGSTPAPARLTCLTVFTGLLLVTRRCYMFTVIVLFAAWALWVVASALRRRDGAALKRLLLFGTISIAVVGGALAPLFWRLFHTDYADIYAAYMSGGLPGELANQLGYLGLLPLALMAVGVAFGLRRPGVRFLALLVPAAPLAIVALITRVQNMSTHQSLAAVPFYLLGLYLCFGAVCAGASHRGLRRLSAAVCAAVVLGGACAGGFAPFALPGGVLFSTARLTEPPTRGDLADILAVTGWLSGHYPGNNTAYMLCHNETYNPDIFRTVALPDETLRDILPYGAADAGNDKFPTALFTAQVVLTTTPEDNSAYRRDLAAAFEAVQRQTGHFTLEAEFPLGDTTLYAYKRTAPATAEEVALYRALLADWDERYPQNFRAVFDEWEAALSAGA